MKKLFISIFLFIFFINNIYSQETQNNENKTLIVYGYVTNIISDISTYNKYHGYLCKLKDVSVILGDYSKDTITIIINTGSMMRLNINEKVIISAQLYKGLYASFREEYDFSPFPSNLRINKSSLNYYGITDIDSLINPYRIYFSKTNTKNIDDKISITLNYIYDKEKYTPLRIFAVRDLKFLYTENCMPYSYVENTWISLYNDTTLDNEIREEASRMIIGYSEEQSYSLYDYNIANNLYSTLYSNNSKTYLEYVVPFWKSGVKFCDSLIYKYETIIKGFPEINDTISLSKKDNLFFFGKIKKISKNKLTIKNLKIFEGKYSDDKITIRTDIDTIFNKEIIGKNILINAALINNKYILELKPKNKGFCMPPLTPDGNNMFIVNEINLNKNNVKIKPNEFLKIISEYYLILNSPVKNKEKELIKIITKGKYQFLRKRSLWEFSDLSLQYDSLCWDYNKKYNFLDSLCRRFNKYKAPPIEVITTADLLLTKSFNQNYSSKYNTNVYELDYHRNFAQQQRLEGFLNSKDIFAQQYAVMRFQDLIKYYANLKKILNSRIEKYDN